MLIVEFGISHVEGSREAIADEREHWRRIQLRAAVADAPEVAVQELERRGYVVDNSKADRVGSPNRMREA